MARYLIERTFAERATFPSEAAVDRDVDDCVTWLHSYVSADGRTCFCLYDAPSPEAIRRASAREGLPVDRITEVRVRNPYAHEQRA